jgi:uncharacterized SAM-binding protein YcdF (DUF218 family)
LTSIAVALGRGPGSEATRSVARKACRLYLDGKVQYVLFSGRWSVFSSQDYASNEALDMRQVAYELGIPEAAILMDEWSRDTVSNMVGTRRALRKAGFYQAHLVVVTIPYAGRRAMYLARKVLGNNFTFDHAESAYDFSYSPTEEADLTYEERKIFWITRASLALAPTGNLRVIAWILRLWHPGYQRRKVEDPIVLSA